MATPNLRASSSAAGVWRYPPNCLAVINGYWILDIRGAYYAVWCREHGTIATFVNFEDCVGLARTDDSRPQSEEWKPGEVPLV
jgi:hypothetical protein